MVHQCPEYRCTQGCKPLSVVFSIHNPSSSMHSKAQEEDTVEDSSSKHIPAPPAITFCPVTKVSFMLIPLRSNIALRVRQWTWFRQNTSGTFPDWYEKSLPLQIKYACKNPTKGLCPGASPALRSTTISVYLYIMCNIINRLSQLPHFHPTHTH